MSETVVIQSAAPERADTVATVIESVHRWAERQGYDYRFQGDELFERLPAWVLKTVGPRRQMAADIARLMWITELLDTGHKCVIWLDADVVVFDPAMRIGHDRGYAFGREAWVQPDPKRPGAHKVHRNVHNAVLMFTGAGRVTLDFYLQTATEILRDAGPDVPAQLVGPKLLTALHNVVRLPLTESVGMASPLVLHDLAAGGGPAWDAVRDAHGGDLGALNLCTSLLGTETDGIEVDDALIRAAIKSLEGNV